MVEYCKENIRFTDTQLKKLKTAVNILAPLGITAAASAIDGGTQKNTRF